ncbi:hypothetical protein [Deinococcus altitudinis]|uniref:hypothetical protein n=1 Tax=Deinococcus altitudinis TaxID=468914 RepID=UPI0038916142
MTPNPDVQTSPHADLTAQKEPLSNEPPLKAPLSNEPLFKTLSLGFAALDAGLRRDGSPEDQFPVPGLDLLRGSGFWGAGGDTALTGPQLLRLMRLVGRASLPLGRLFEGHVNALALISAYGTAGQRARTAQEVREGRLFGVWNTEGPDGVQLLGASSDVRSDTSSDPGGLTLQGAKTFASGGLQVTRPLLPVDRQGERQLVLLRADAPESVAREVPGSWQPLGMAATGSVKLDFSGSRVEQDDLIGRPGDYYRQPMFSAGALRFCAVQQGGAERLLDEARAYLHRLGRGHDEVQALRFAGCWTGLQGAALLLAEGERLERACLAGKVSEARLLAQVDAVRLATEDACLALLEASERAVGARGLLEPEPFSRLIRDLRMYLRQPAPDAARLRLGHWVMNDWLLGEWSLDEGSLDESGSEDD